MSKLITIKSSIDMTTCNQTEVQYRPKHEKKANFGLNHSNNTCQIIDQINIKLLNKWDL